MGAVWVAAVAAYARGPVTFVPWFRVGIAVPVVVACVAGMLRPRGRGGMAASSALAGWAVLQLIRIQFLGYPWRTLALAGSAYAMILTAFVAIGAYCALDAAWTEMGMPGALMCAGRRADGDDGAC